MVTEAMCDHQLSGLKSFFASGPFKFQCLNCGALVYREHPKAVLPWRVLFIDGIGILFIAVLFLVFAYLPIATVIFLATSGLLYLVDLSIEPLKEHSVEEAREHDKKSKIALGVFVMLLVLGVGAYLWQP